MIFCTLAIFRYIQREFKWFVNNCIGFLYFKQHHSFLENSKVTFLYTDSKFKGHMPLLPLMVVSLCLK